MKKSLILILVCGIFVPQLSAQKLSLQDNNKVSSEVSKITEIVLPAPEMGGGMPLMEALAHRATNRRFLPESLSEAQLSNLLWAANGVNRTNLMKRTAPSARNAQEIDIYVCMENGVFFYDARKHKLTMVVDKDVRKDMSNQKFVPIAPVVLVFVADFTKMDGFSDEAKEFYSATDVGYVSQNVYLYCASSNLATVVCGSFNKDYLTQLLSVKESGKVLLIQPVGKMEE